MGEVNGITVLHRWKVIEIKYKIALNLYLLLGVLQIFNLNLVKFLL